MAISLHQHATTLFQHLITKESFTASMSSTKTYDIPLMIVRNEHLENVDPFETDPWTYEEMPNDGAQKQLQQIKDMLDGEYQQYQQKTVSTEFKSKDIDASDSKNPSIHDTYYPAPTFSDSEELYYTTLVGTQVDAMTVKDKERVASKLFGQMYILRFLGLDWTTVLQCFLPYMAAIDAWMTTPADYISTDYDFIEAPLKKNLFQDHPLSVALQYYMLRTMFNNFMYIVGPYVSHMYGRISHKQSMDIYVTMPISGPAYTRIYCHGRNYMRMKLYLKYFLHCSLANLLIQICPFDICFWYKLKLPAKLNYARLRIRGKFGSSISMLGLSFLHLLGKMYANIKNTHKNLDCLTVHNAMYDVHFVFVVKEGYDYCSRRSWDMFSIMSQFDIPDKRFGLVNLPEMYVSDTRNFVKYDMNEQPTVALFCLADIHTHFLSSLYITYMEIFNYAQIDQHVVNRSSLRVMGQNNLYKQKIAITTKLDDIILYLNVHYYGPHAANPNAELHNFSLYKSAANLKCHIKRAVPRLSSLCLIVIMHTCDMLIENMLMRQNTVNDYIVFKPHEYTRFLQLYGMSYEERKHVVNAELHVKVPKYLRTW